MKYLFFIFLYTQVQASLLNVECVSELPTTSFFIETVGHKTNVKVINHNGMGYAPFWNSLIVPNDILQLTKKANLLLKLDQVIETNWNNDDCKFYGEQKFSCIGNAERVISNKIELSPWAVYSSQHQESSFAGDFKFTELAFQFYIDNQAYEIVMKYKPSECQVSENNTISKLSKKSK